MKKILQALSLFLLCLMVPTSFSPRVYGQDQSVDLTLTIPAEAAPELEKLVKEEKEKLRDKETYTEASWEAYQKALQKAEEVLTNTPYDEEKVTAALIDLKKAIQGLTPRKKTSGVVPVNATKPKANAQTTTSKYPATGMAVDLGLASLGVLLVGTTSILWLSSRRKAKDSE